MNTFQVMCVRDSKGAAGKVARVIEFVMRDRGFEKAGPGDAPDRQIRLTPATAAKWITIADGQWSIELDDAETMAETLSAALGETAIVHGIVEDSQLFSLTLYREGSATDEIARQREVDQDDLATRSAQWAAALGGRGVKQMAKALSAFLSRPGEEAPIDEIAELLGLGVGDWLELNGAAEEDDAPAPPGTRVLSFKRAPAPGEYGAHVLAAAGDPLAVPEFLFGTTRAVRARCKAFMKRLQKSGGDWDAALAGERMLDLHASAEQVVLRGPVEGEDDASMLIFPMEESLQELTAERSPLEIQRARTIFLNGMDRFWVALIGLCQVPLLFPLADKKTAQDYALDALEKTLLWWEEFYRVGPKFFGTWWNHLDYPGWSRGIVQWWHSAGRTEEELIRSWSMGPGETVDYLRSWVTAKRGA